MQKNSRYSIRGFNRENLAEVELFHLMSYHPTTLKARGYWKRNFDYEQEVDLTRLGSAIFDLSPRVSRKYEDVLFAVADRLDRIVGWVWFYCDNTHPLPAKIVNELGLTPRNSRIYQLSYEKLMSEGWPEELVDKAQYVTVSYLERARKGVIVEGLRLAIARLARSYRRLYIKRRKLVLYGFVHGKNLASRIVLERNGFVKQAKRYSYDGVPHQLWVKVV